MYGYVAEEIIGQPIRILLPTRERVAEIEEILGKINNGERVPYKRPPVGTKDGTVFPVSVTIYPNPRTTSAAWSAHAWIARDISNEGARIQAELRLRTDDLSARTGTWRPSPIRSPTEPCVPRCERWMG